jgi:hypothetical protein
MARVGSRETGGAQRLAGSLIHQVVIGQAGCSSFGLSTV